MKSPSTVALRLFLLAISYHLIYAQESRAPYLLFATWNGIYRISPNGSDMQLLVQEQAGGIVAIDYHYRLDYVFWSNINKQTIEQAHVNGSNIKIIIANELKYPADLAVDWINDNLYWTNRDSHLIEEFNLKTSVRRVVLYSGMNSLPVGIAVYPYPGYGWLYWADRTTHSIERVAITGAARETLYTQVTCAAPLTLDYSSHTVYWIDYCSYRIESLNMNGDSSTHSAPVSKTIAFPSGITQLEDMIYWTEPTQIFAVNKTRGEPVVQLYRGYSNNQLGGLEIVHTSKQPPTEEFVRLYLSPSENMTCEPPCQNGQCVPPNLCACSNGWTALDCSVDVDECEVTNGGCDHNCKNFIGSYECFCDEGYVLLTDGKRCENTSLASILTPSSVFSTPITDTLSTSIILPDTPTVDTLSTSIVLPDTPPVDTLFTSIVLPDTPPVDTLFTSIVLPDTPTVDTLSTSIVLPDTPPVDTLFTSIVLLDTNTLPTSLIHPNIPTVNILPTSTLLSITSSVNILPTSIFLYTSTAHSTSIKSVSIVPILSISTVVSAPMIHPTNVHSSILTVPSFSVPTSSLSSETVSVIMRTHAIAPITTQERSTLLHLSFSSALQISPTSSQQYTTTLSPSPLVSTTSSSLFTNGFSSMSSHTSGEPRSHSTPLLLAPKSDTIGNLPTTLVTLSTTASITAPPRSESISEETGLPLSTISLATSGPPSGENKLHSSAKPSSHTLVSNLLTGSAIPTSGPSERDDNGNIMTIIIAATSVSGVILIITIVIIMLLLYIKCTGRRKSPAGSRTEEVASERSFRALCTSSATPSWNGRQNGV